jgi:hypothetical protein
MVAFTYIPDRKPPVKEVVNLAAFHAMLRPWNAYVVSLEVWLLDEQPDFNLRLYERPVWQYWDACFLARMSNGRAYFCCFADRDVLWGYLNRSRNLKGVTISWQGQLVTLNWANSLVAPPVIAVA